MTTEMTGAQPAQPDRTALRAEIESARKDFHELLASLSDEDWRKKSANPAWSVGQLMWHLGRGAEFSVRLSSTAGRAARLTHLAGSSDPETYC